MYKDLPPSHSCILLLLLLAFVNYAGKGIYFIPLAVAVLVLQKNVWKYIDFPFISLLLFGGTYAFFYDFHYRIVNRMILAEFFILIPSCYIYGRVLGSEYGKYASSVLFAAAVALAFIPILSVLVQVNKLGFVYEDRGVFLLGRSSTRIASATYVASMIAPLCFFSCSIMFDIRKKKLYFVFAILSMFCALFLQSRTLIVCFVLTIVLSLFYSRQYIRKHIFIFICSFVAAAITVWLLLERFVDQLVVIERFKGDDVATGNGRTDRQLDVIDQLIETPLGGFADTLAYAHNLFLDSARVAGIVPMLFLIFFVSMAIIRIMPRKANCVPGYNFYWIFFLIILLYFNTEPILEGASMTFSFFCFLTGILTSLNLKKSNS